MIFNHFVMLRWLCSGHLADVSLHQWHCFPLGIPKVTNIGRHGYKLVAAPYVRNATICGKEELWVFLSCSLHRLSSFLPPSFYSLMICWIREHDKSFRLPCFFFFVLLFPRHLSCQSDGHFSESTIHSQYTPPPLSQTPTPIILSLLFVLAWDRWLVSQLISLRLCSKGENGRRRTGVLHTDVCYFSPAFYCQWRRRRLSSFW